MENPQSLSSGSVTSMHREFGAETYSKTMFVYHKDDYKNSTQNNSS